MSSMRQNKIAATFSMIARALAHRNYRLFFFGQGVSLIGTWMQQAALTWLTYDLTNSALLLGTVAFAGQISAFVASPVTGVLADRWNRHGTLVVTQSLSMIHAVLTTVLVMTGVINVGQIIALAVIIGLINALDMPARQALVVDMIEDRADLGNAIALNSLIFHSARLIGPMAAGITIAVVGEWPCFLLNAISFLAVLAALLAMRIAPRTGEPSSGRLLHSVREGIDYAFRSMPIRTLLALIATVSLAGAPLGVLMPVIAKEILGGQSATFGLLGGVPGLGALAGALFLAMRKNVLGLGRLMVMMIAVLGVATIGVACSRTLAISLVLLTFVGFAVVVAVAASNTILQTIVDEDKRGRVMSLYLMAFLGTAPFGSLLAGGFAVLFGTPWTLAISGAVCIVAALVFALRLPALRASVHPIYAREGIIPEVSSAIQTVTELTAPPEDCG
jgi:MFS family permease